MNSDAIEQQWASEERLRDVLNEIRGVCLGNGPKSQRKQLAAINSLVGFALHGDCTDSKYVKRYRKGTLTR